MNYCYNLLQFNILAIVGDVILNQSAVSNLTTTNIETV